MNFFPHIWLNHVVCASIARSPAPLYSVQFKWSPRVADLSVQHHLLVVFVSHWIHPSGLNMLQVLQLKIQRKVEVDRKQGVLNGLQINFDSVWE
jgi:hypothetical protein